MFIKRLNILLFIILFAQFCAVNLANADPATYYPNEEEEFDSQIKWENFIKNNGIAATHSCSGKLIWDSSELDNTCIPTVITKEGDSCDTNGAGNSGALIIGALSGGAGLAVGGLSAGVAIAALPFAIVAAGISYGVMTDACASMYVMAPHEVVNKNLGNKCTDVGDKVVWPDSAITNIDVPYFFHCDPRYDPNTGASIPNNKQEWIGRTLGYAGSASAMCNNSKLSSQMSFMKNSVNSIYVASYSWLERIWYSNWKPCESGIRGSDPKKVIPGEDSVYVYPANVEAYYRVNPTSGKIQICAAAPYFFIPIRIGCTTTAPPGDEVNIDPFLLNYVQDTRCAYLIKPREDLQSLGSSLSAPAHNPVKKFLMSELHITSTVVGCIKDMLIKIFVKSPNVQVVNGPKPFFQVFQERMKQIVSAALVLFATLLGIKIMTSGQPPQRAEMIMYAIKFALVIYFALGPGFYEVKNNQVEGLFPSLMQVPDELANIFLEAQNVNDPGQYCYFPYKQGNLLGENEVGVSEFGGGVVATEGSRGNGFVKMTVWDLVDCKMVNYLTLGSCDYSLSGMLSAWFTSASLLSSKIGVILAIVSFFYTLFVLMTMFKFAHIFILCMFTVTILIFLAPIFLLFMLFDATKNITTQWFKWILAYLIYPALLFAFVALIFATFDAVFYGNVQVAGNTSANGVDYKAACAGIDSVFCKTQELIGYVNSCEGGTITAKLIEKKEPIEGAGKFNALKDSIAEAYFNGMLKMLLFAFLFYLFLDSVTSFMAIMLGVVGMGDVAKGVGVIAAPMAAVGGFAARVGGKAAGTVAGGAVGAAAGGIARGVSAARRK